MSLAFAVIRRRAVICAVAPAAVALVASAVASVGSLRMTEALREGAVSVAEAAAGVPRFRSEAATTAAPADTADPDGVDYESMADRILGASCPAGLAPCEDLGTLLDDAQRVEVRVLLVEVVRIGVRRAREQPSDVRVEWPRERTARGERIVDVVTEGASLVRSYHVQVRAIMRDPAKGSGFLVERLRRKIARSA